MGGAIEDRPVARAQGHLVVHALGEQLIERVLTEQSDVPSGPRATPAGCDSAATPRAHQAGQHAGQGALAGAVLADQRNELAGV